MVERDRCSVVPGRRGAGRQRGATSSCGRPGAQHVLLYLLSHTQLQVKAIHNLKLHIRVQYTYSSFVHTYTTVFIQPAGCFQIHPFFYMYVTCFVQNSQLLTEEDVVDLAWACFIIAVINMARLPRKMR